MTRLASIALCVLAVAMGLGAAPRESLAGSGRTQVIVTLSGAPLAYADSRREAVPRLRAEQHRFLAALRSAVPEATVRRRYELVANGYAVVLPRSDVSRVAALPGVRRVFPAGSYVALGGPAREEIGAAALSRLAGATGEGIKIGIIDDGVDQTHPFFDPATYTVPPGFPKGNRAFTTAKVIVARAFAPRGATYSGARKPFDTQASFHGTHVAGIAAGNAGTKANGARISGIAPRAWIGNYKALSIPTDAGVGLDGNAPELVAAIEAAVADGMDVINLSLGEPEIEPEADIVAEALDAVAAAGVVPVVAAGNDFDDFGPGSLASPGSAAGAITVAAITAGQLPEIASFSSSGPTPLSLRLKPDVAAPGVGILSSVPGDWAAMSGTSMASPHVAGAAALLLEQHPEWTPGEVKAALVGSAQPVRDEGAPALPVRAGAGAIDVVAAATPLVLAQPTSLSFGLVADGETRTETITLADAGAGAGTWDVVVEQAAPAAPILSTAATVTVPGELQIALAAPLAATDSDVTGVIRLQREGVTRRIPFWGRLATSALAAAPATPLPRPGVVKGSTAGRPATVTVYRYPEVPADGAVNGRLAGPEQIFAVTVRRHIANFGVVILSRGRGVTVEPRVVRARDENRLTGYAALPFNLNPYLAGFGEPVLAAGAIEPAVGTYTVVFDSRTTAGAGPFTFRFWVDDRTPPTVRVLTPAVKRGSPIRIRMTDSGSGVSSTSIVARVDGRPVPIRLKGTIATIATGGIARGSRMLRLQVSDFQETRNMENVAAILPNTRVVRVKVTIR